MKLWIFIPVVVLFFFQSPAALAKRESLLLTESEFMALTFSEQKHYIKKVREIIVEMNENNPYLVSELAKRAKLFSVLLGSGISSVSAEAKEDEKKSALPEIQKELTELIQNQAPTQKKIMEMIEKLSTNSRYFSTGIAYEIEKSSSKTDLKLLEAHLDQALISAKLAAFLNKDKITDPESKNNMQKTKIDPIIEYVETAQNKMKIKFPNWNFKKSEVEISDIKKGNIREADLKDLQNNNRIISYHKRDDIENKLLAENTNYRCMYAGFVIKSGSCVGLQKIPWNLTGINLDKYTCENDTRMCNPLIFGVDVSSCDWSSTRRNDEKSNEANISDCLLKSKPFCTPRSPNATKNCAILSNTNDALETAVYLIRKSPQNKMAFKEFTVELENLCDRQMTNSKNMKDILSTCEKAKSQFYALGEKLRTMNQNSTTPPPKASGSAR